ncbi:DsbA family protein [Rhodoblastus sp.]|uniref:DsbA family protein n=1 Tax=Rhodoblastus sp. TaxID=1962975 RepID=UPI00262AE217|nr:DsbA family protein [Rhodoblastus sp.]
MNRRFLLRLAALGAGLALHAAAPARAEQRKIDVEAILNDPAAPVGGNPKGDVTIVAFFDYNCPFCKKATPELEKLVRTDGHIRLVYKDWPILTEASVYGAHLALAAEYQGKYERVHDALMAVPGRRNGEDAMLAAVKGSGVDMDRLKADLKTHEADISALIKRNNDQAQALGLEGTPVFLIGPFKVAAALNYDEFKKVVAQVRAAQNGH